MSEYGDDLDDHGQETVSELQNVHSKLEDVNSTLEEIQSTLADIRSVLKDRSPYSWIWILIIASLIDFWSGSKLDRITDRLWYSMNYNADWQNVDIQRRPTDCDLLHAPIGVKGCSFSKEKTIFDEAERQKWMAQAQTQDEKNAISKRPNSVTIYWVKKDEP